MREQSIRSHLRKLGFTEATRAEKLLADPILDGVPGIPDSLVACPDPDQGLLGLLRIAEQDKQRLVSILTDPLPAHRLLALIGTSTTLTDFLVTHPHWLDDLRNDPREPVDHKARFIDALTSDSSPVDLSQGTQIIRETYYRELTALASYDLSLDNQTEAFPTIAARITDLVDAALEASLHLARAVTPGGAETELAIIAMGKTGARELNYISDVDVMYVTRDDDSQRLATATKLATLVGSITSGAGSIPPLWPLDAGLRPEGKDGPLVRTLDSYVAYYKRWAKDWEFQALLKARPVAGDHDLGHEFTTAIAPFIWSASARDGFVESSRAMRKRVETTIKKSEAGRQLKLGQGGLRDVEFTVQLLQLVHGRVDESLRMQTTLDALAALRDGGYVARSDAEKLDSHYRFLRTLEHRIQLQRLKRSHLVPTADHERRRIARSMGISTGEELEKTWLSVRQDVRQLHESIYYRPLLPAAARLSDSDISLQPQAAQDRLEAIGYRDPKRALNNIRALTEGVSRTAKIQRQLLPVLIGWFADGPGPDAALLQFRILSETMGSTHWYLKLLRDSGVAAQRLASILSSSPYLAAQIPKHTESVRWLASDRDLHVRDDEDLRGELESLMSRRDKPEDMARAGKYLRRRIILRTSLGFVTGVVDPQEARHSITLGAEIAIDAGLRAAIAEVLARHHLDEAPSTYLVVGMGSCGGRDMGINSDADFLFVHEPIHDDDHVAQEVAVDIASTLVRLLGSATDEEPVKLDADLRPEGRNGPLARSFAAYQEYYDRWSEPWERQALLRARALVGDEGLKQRFGELVNKVRYDTEFTAEDERQFKRMKARIEKERIPRAIKPSSHIKLGPGGILDIEWVAQYLQLKYARDHHELRTTSTAQVISEATKLGFLTEDQGLILAQAWDFSQRLRFAIDLSGVRSSRTDIMPQGQDTPVVASLLGDLAPADIEEVHQKLNRRARTVVEHVIFQEHST